MAKISQSLTFTVKIGDKESTQHVKVGLEISEVDTERPLPEQLNIKTDKDIPATVESLWKFVKRSLDKQLDEIFDDVKQGKKE